jgi:hypothetical protein
VRVWGFPELNFVPWGVFDEAYSITHSDAGCLRPVLP